MANYISSSFLDFSMNIVQMSLKKATTNTPASPLYKTKQVLLYEPQYVPSYICVNPFPEQLQKPKESDQA